MPVPMSQTYNESLEGNVGTIIQRHTSHQNFHSFGQLGVKGACKGTLCLGCLQFVFLSDAQ